MGSSIRTSMFARSPELTGSVSYARPPHRFALSITRSKRTRPLIFNLCAGTVARTHSLRNGPPSPKNGTVRRLSPNQTPKQFAPRCGDPSETRPDLDHCPGTQVRQAPLTRRFPQGSRLVRLLAIRPPPHCLTPDFFAAADPRISFDGARVLFAGKKTADSPWQIWEMNVDGSGARQVTHCPGDCLKPAYLPRGQIVYTALPAEPAGTSSRLRGATLCPPSATRPARTARKLLNSGSANWMAPTPTRSPSARATSRWKRF